jgi:hypothetical protein
VTSQDECAKPGQPLPPEPSGTDQAVTALAEKIRRILDGGFYQPGWEIFLEQLSVDADAPLELTRYAAVHLHQQGLLQLLGPAPELTRRQSAGGTAEGRTAQLLRERIAANRYPVGTRLPTQDALARELHAAKVTVGSALDALAREGWVKRKPRRAAKTALPLHEVRGVRVPAATGTHRGTSHGQRLPSTRTRPSISGENGET